MNLYASEPKQSLLIRILSRWPLSRFIAPISEIRYKMLSRQLKGQYNPHLAMIIKYYGHPHIAEQLSIPSQNLAFQRNLENLTQLLDDHQIDFFVVPNEQQTRLSIAVLKQDWSRMTTAITSQGKKQRSLFIGANVINSEGRVKVIGARANSEEAMASLPHQQVVQYYVLQTDQSGATQFARECSVSITQWEFNENHDLVNHEHNPYTTEISKVDSANLELSFNGHKYPSKKPFTEPLALTFDKPVDVVYMWVDGADPNWARKRAETVGSITGMSKDSIDNSRFRDNGELKYSLRSLYYHAPWVRNIYLVTDEQVPAWLDLDNSRVKVIDHKDIFASYGKLPTYNSHAIAGRIHHIPGLAEHYLILNDDVFFGADARPENFFTLNGLSYFFLSRSTLGSGSREFLTHESARKNVQRLLKQDFGKTVTRNFFHTPVPQTKSILFELEEKYHHEFARTWTNQLRSDSDFEINGWLHHYYAFLTQRAIPGAIKYDYFDLSDIALTERLRRLQSHRNVTVFCVNDNPEAPAKNIRFFSTWLEEFFPVPAPWEKGI